MKVEWLERDIIAMIKVVSQGSQRNDERTSLKMQRGINKKRARVAIILEAKCREKPQPHSKPSKKSKNKNFKIAINLLKWELFYGIG